jgi:hypothetical protein
MPRATECMAQSYGGRQAVSKRLGEPYEGCGPDLHDVPRWWGLQYQLRGVLPASLGERRLVSLRNMLLVRLSAPDPKRSIQVAQSQEFCRTARHQLLPSHRDF